MDWREALQRAVDEAKAKTGEIQPQWIFIDGLPFEQTEWTALRCNDYIMDHFDLVLELKRLGTSMISDIIPDTINGYKVKFIFEITPSKIVRTGCVDVRYIASIYRNGYGSKATAFGRLEAFDLGFDKADEYFRHFTRMARFRIEEDTQKLLLCLCRAANEKRREEDSQFYKNLKPVEF